MEGEQCKRQDECDRQGNNGQNKQAIRGLSPHLKEALFFCAHLLRERGYLGIKRNAPPIEIGLPPPVLRLLLFQLNRFAKQRDSAVDCVFQAQAKL